MSLFTACSDDDEPVVPGPGENGESGTLEEVITNDIAGDYKGELAVTVLGVPMDPVAQKVAVTKSGTEAVSLSINNFSFLGMSLGDIELNDCALTEENGVYTFTGTTSLDVTPVPGTNLTADVAGEGSFTTGTPTSITLNLDIKAELAGQQQDVTVVYTGTRLTGNESSEAQIIGFTIDSEFVSEAPVIDHEVGSITFKVLDSAESLVFAPVITVSDGATVSPASGVEQDFSDPVTYTVTAEDGTVKTYTVWAITQSVLTYSFENWEDGDENDTLLPEEIWASSAAGAGILGGTLLKKETNEDGTFAAKMITFEYPGDANSLIPKITAGSIFIGTFDMMPALMGDRLSCTKFGLPAADLGLTKQPVRFKGMYKYTAGAQYLNATDPSNIIETEDVDQGSITAVLYKAKDAEGNEVTLTGHDVNTSGQIVAYAMVVTDNTEEGYQTFDIPFEVKGDYEADGEYKFAIVCTSSIKGDTFNGAGGSTLIVDEFQVICE